MRRAKCIIAHPDDEVIWAAPFLRQHRVISKAGRKITPPSWRINKVVCLTCQGNSERSLEFTNSAAFYDFSYSLFDTPIQRKFSLEEWRTLWTIISSEFDNEVDICITHSLYGDDHFHPQHIAISLICLVLSYYKNVPLIFSHSPKPFVSVVRDAFTRTNFTVKSFSFLPIKLMTICLSYLITSPYLTASASHTDLKGAEKIYASQSFDYQNIRENKFSFRKRIGVSLFRL